jgi:ATP-dependent RNA helicase DHX33
LISDEGNNGYVPERLQQEKRKLPIYPAKGKIINQIQRLDTAVLIGETGSGKTTQIPQVKPQKYHR